MLYYGWQEIGLVQFIKVVIATNYRMIAIISTMKIPIEHMRMILSCGVCVYDKCDKIVITLSRLHPCACGTL